MSSTSYTPDSTAEGASRRPAYKSSRLQATMPKKSAPGKKSRGAAKIRAQIEALTTPCFVKLQRYSTAAEPDSLELSGITEQAASPSALDTPRRAPSPSPTTEPAEPEEPVEPEAPEEPSASTPAMSLVQAASPSALDTPRRAPSPTTEPGEPEELVEPAASTLAVPLPQERKQRGRLAAANSLKESGLNRAFHPDQLAPLQEYLREYRLSERSVKDSCPRIMRAARRFLFFAAQREENTEPDYMHLVDTDMMLRWVKSLRETSLSASTIANYLFDMNYALDFVADRFDNNASTMKLAYRRLELLRKELQKDKRLEDAENRAKDDAETEATDPVTFSVPLKHASNINRFAGIAAKTGTSATRDDFSFATDFALAHLLIPNGQRAGAASNLTIEEYRNGKPVGDKYVVDVHRHKTATNGPARLTMDMESKFVLDRYLQIRIERFPANTTYFLLTTNGTQVRKVCDKLRSVHNNTGLPGRLPTPTQMRKAVTRAVHDTGAVEDARTLAEQMTHSPVTACRNYTARSLKKTVEGAALVCRTIDFASTSTSN